MSVGKKHIQWLVEAMCGMRFVTVWTVMGAVWPRMHMKPHPDCGIFLAMRAEHPKAALEAALVALAERGIEVVD